MDDLLTDERIDDRDGFLVSILSGRLVPRADRRGHLADRRAHAGAQCDVPGAVLLSLAGSLFGGLGIGHSISVIGTCPPGGGPVVCVQEGGLSTQTGLTAAGASHKLDRG